MSPPAWLSPRIRAALGVLLLIAVLAGLGARQYHLVVIPGQPEQSRELGRNGLADFADVIYYPLQAIRDGVNPYDSSLEPRADGSPRYRQRYPVLNLFPLYSPLLFVLYWPFAFMDFTTSAAIYVIANVALLLVLSVAIWRSAGLRPSVAHVTTLASVVLVTQAGRANFLGGETAIPLALATIGAVMFAPQYPGLAGLALAVSTFKPTFGLPLGILLLAAGHFRTVAVGWGLGFVIGMAGMVLIFANSGDLARMVEMLSENQQAVDAIPDVDAQQSAARVDSAGAIQRLTRWHTPVGKLISSGIVLTAAGIALWQLGRAVRRAGTAQSLQASIICLATVSSLYHLTYDAVLLWAPIVITLFAPASLWPGISSRWRWWVAGLLLIPMVNVLPTATVQRSLAFAFPALTTGSPELAKLGWALACSLNGISLLIALALMAWQSSQIAKVGPRS
jgi:hypothetical protein